MILSPTTMTPPISNTDRILTSFEAKDLIQPCTLDQIRNRMIHLYGDHYQHDYLTIHVLYLGYLLARCDMDKIEEFMEEHKEHLVAILNTQQPEFFGGTVLHMALYWNSGQLGISLFELLYNNGAVPIQDEYNQFPWEQVEETMIWVHPFGHSIGVRKSDEFVGTYHYLKTVYEEI